MKSVLRKIALMREHNVELSSISELNEKVQDANNYLNKFRDEFGQFELMAKQLVELGNEAIVLSNVVRDLGKGVEDSLSELGMSPSEVDGLNDYFEYTDDIERTKDDMENAISLLEDIVNNNF
jgi:lysyl-tRNA synthetase class I